MSGPPPSYAPMHLWTAYKHRKNKNRCAHEMATRPKRSRLLRPRLDRCRGRKDPTPERRMRHQISSARTRSALTPTPSQHFRSSSALRSHPPNTAQQPARSLRLHLRTTHARVLSRCKRTAKRPLRAHTRPWSLDAHHITPSRTQLHPSDSHVVASRASSWIAPLHRPTMATLCHDPIVRERLYAPPSASHHTACTRRRGRRHRHRPLRRAAAQPLLCQTAEAGSRHPPPSTSPRHAATIPPHTSPPALRQQMTTSPRSGGVGAALSRGHPASRRRPAHNQPHGVHPLPPAPAARQQRHITTGTAPTPAIKTATRTATWTASVC